jgi:putative ABC transport system substrate-binding protein
MTLALAILIAPLTVEAQLAGKVPRVGVLQATFPRSRPSVQAFERGLRDLGYVEGRNLVIEFRSAEGNPERLGALAVELVQRQVDVMLAMGPEATLRAARQATSTMPIVMVAVDDDPLALGYRAGLPRPGGQITGLFLQQIEITGKGLELLNSRQNLEFSY